MTKAPTSGTIYLRFSNKPFINLVGKEKINEKNKSLRSTGSLDESVG